MADGSPHPSVEGPSQEGNATELIRTSSEMAARQEAARVYYTRTVAEISSHDVSRIVTVAILTAAGVLGGLYLFWLARQVIGWCVGGCAIAAALTPAVNWVEGFRIKRSVAILIVYGALLLVGVGMVALFLPPLLDQIRGLTAYGLGLISRQGRSDDIVMALADDFGVTPYLPRLTAWLQSLSGELTMVAGGFLSYTTQVISSVAAVVSMLFIAFYLLLDGQNILQRIIPYFPERQQPRVERILRHATKAISGYMLGNIWISVICGVAVFVVLIIMRMPYAGALALMVAIFDLIPEVGATLGGIALVVAGFFVSPSNSLILLVYFIVYQQIENYFLQPVIYSRQEKLHPLTIFVVVILGGIWLGIFGALLAIPTAEILHSIFIEWRASRHEQRVLTENRGQ